MTVAAQTSTTTAAAGTATAGAGAGASGAAGTTSDGAAAAAATGASSTATLLTPAPTTDTGKTGAEAGAATQDATKAAETASSEVELKFPDGFKADDQVVTGFKAVAKELGLKSESAQKLADIYVRTEQARAEAWTVETSKWAETSKSDKEFGGAKFDANLGVAKKAMDKFASPELRQLLETSGLGNHPEVLRLMVKVGQALKEDSVSGAAGAAGRIDPKEAELMRRYPSMYPKK